MGRESFAIPRNWAQKKTQYWVFHKMGVPQNGWFTMEVPIKMDDLGVPFQETSMDFFFMKSSSY